MVALTGFTKFALFTFCYMGALLLPACKMSTGMPVSTTPALWALPTNLVRIIYELQESSENLYKTYQKSENINLTFDWKPCLNFSTLLMTLKAIKKDYLQSVPDNTAIIEAAIFQLECLEDRNKRPLLTEVPTSIPPSFDKKHYIAQFLYSFSECTNRSLTH